MARIEEIKLVDDLDGGEAAETVPFSLDGRHREIDLSAENAERLRELLAPFVEASRRAVRAPATRTARSASGGSRSAAEREHNRAVREWAQGRGYSLGDRGRIPAEVLNAYANRSAA